MTLPKGKVYWALFILMGVFLYPIWQEALLAYMVSLTLIPVRNGLNKLTRLPKGFCSLLTFVFFLAFIIMPFVFATKAALNDVNLVTKDIKMLIESNGMAKTLFPEVTDPSEPLPLPLPVEATYGDVFDVLKDGLKTLQSTLVKSVPQYLKDGVSILRTLFIFLFLTLVFLAYDERVVSWFKESFSEDKSLVDTIHLTLREASKSILSSVVLVGLVQGALLGIAYKFAGFEKLFTLTMISMVVSMVPFFGAPSCYILSACYLGFVQDDMSAGLMFAAYGFLIVSLSDNVLRAFILRGETRVHPVLIFLFMLTGIIIVGPMGIFFGPLAYIIFSTVRRRTALS